MITLRKLPSLLPDDPKAHHVGNPPTGFQNPWPSFDVSHGSPLKLFQAKFGRNRPAFVPVPADRNELVQVRKVDFDALKSGHGFRITWIGHASFLLQTSKPTGSSSRGMNILCDPVFSERTSPVTFLGPKRYTPTPCTLQELTDKLDIDVIVISHNHYDHADAATLKHVYSTRGPGNIQILAGIHSSRWLTGLGIAKSDITELDWWDRVEISLSPDTTKTIEMDQKATNGDTPAPPAVRITCTPTQHFSSRSPFDRGHDLWCSYAIEELHPTTTTAPKKIYFAGDTGYRSIPSSTLSRAEEDALPFCPAFSQIGDLLGPFDLALLPIGLCRPRELMSNVHANSWDSIRIHKEVRAKKSIGMHWGTVRGGISQEYEDVRWPPKEWEEVAKENGLAFGRDGEIGLLDIGEVLVLE